VIDRRIGIQTSKTGALLSVIRDLRGARYDAVALVEYPSRKAFAVASGLFQ